MISNKLSYDELRGMSKKELISIYNKNVERINKQVTRAKEQGINISELAEGFIFNDKKINPRTGVKNLKPQYRAGRLTQKTKMSEEKIASRILTLQSKSYTGRELKAKRVSKKRFEEMFHVKLKPDQITRLEDLEKEAERSYSAQWYELIKQWATRHGYNANNKRDLRLAIDIMRDRQAEGIGSKAAVDNLSERTARIDILAGGKVKGITRDEFESQSKGYDKYFEVEELTMDSDAEEVESIINKLYDIQKLSNKLTERAIRDVFSDMGSRIV